MTEERTELFHLSLNLPSGTPLLLTKELGHQLIQFMLDEGGVDYFEAIKPHMLKVAEGPPGTSYSELFERALKRPNTSKPSNPTN